ncbi:MAG: hypothetical protein U1E28_17180 [Beijerinckiaceae bacterium]
MDRNPAERFGFPLVLIGALLFGSASFAAPRSISDCESIKQADDYNRCLAAFGPVAHVGPVAGETPENSGEAAAIPANADRRISRSGKRGRYGRASSRRHSGHAANRQNGRVRASFSVKDR